MPAQHRFHAVNQLINPQSMAIILHTRPASVQAKTMTKNEQCTFLLACEVEWSASGGERGEGGRGDHTLSYA